MLKKGGKISDAIIENMLSWRHSGFHVYLDPTICPDDEENLENLARYIIRACFYRQRMVYIPKEDTPTSRGSCAKRPGPMIKSPRLCPLELHPRNSGEIGPV
jgi:hypothetical protein